MGYLLRPAADGLLTGLFLQLAVGPVFFYILGITMDGNYINSLFAVSAVTLADYIFIILSLLGIGKLLRQDRAKKFFGMGSALILIIFGLMFFYKGLTAFEAAGLPGQGGWTPVKSFASCFILTISSPLTIVFWGSIFSAKAVEKKYASKELAIFGFAAGAATFIFLTTTIFALFLFSSRISGVMVQGLNCMVGLVLVYYGITRTVTVVFQLPCKAKE